MSDQIEATCEKAFQLAKQYEQECTGCAQSTLAGLMEALGIWSEEAFKAASGLADGLGLTTRGTCGALSGGAMAIGLRFGRARRDFNDPLAAMASYDLVKMLVEQFEERFGGLVCGDIQTGLVGRAFDLRDPEDLAQAMEAGMVEHCSNVTGTTARLAARIILEADSASE